MGGVNPKRKVDVGGHIFLPRKKRRGAFPSFSRGAGKESLFDSMERGNWFRRRGKEKRSGQEGKSLDGGGKKKEKGAPICLVPWGKRGGGRRA